MALPQMWTACCKILHAQTKLLITQGQFWGQSVLGSLCDKAMFFCLLFNAPYHPLTANTSTWSWCQLNIDKGQDDAHHKTCHICWMFKILITAFSSKKDSLHTSCVHTTGNNFTQNQWYQCKGRPVGVSFGGQNNVNSATSAPWDFQ